MSGTAKELLGEIEGFLAQFHVTASKFGVAAVDDGHLVAELRRAQRHPQDRRPRAGLHGEPAQRGSVGDSFW